VRSHQFAYPTPGGVKADDKTRLGFDLIDERREIHAEELSRCCVVIALTKVQTNQCEGGSMVVISSSLQAHNA
jgi:hypothetical protein